MTESRGSLAEDIDLLYEAERSLGTAIDRLVGRASLPNADDLGADSRAVFAAASHVKDLKEARDIIREVKRRLKAYHE